MGKEMQELQKEVRALRRDVKKIIRMLQDPDTILTAEEERLVEKARKEFAEGKTISFEDAKKQLGVNDL